MHCNVNVNNVSNNVYSDGFMTPTKTAKARRMIFNSRVNTSNSFNSLECDMETNINESENVTETENVDNPDIASNVIPVFDQPQLVWPEPLFLKSCDNWRDIVKEINSKDGSDVPKKLNGDFIKFLPKTVNDHHIIQKYLADSKTEFFTNHLKNERPLKVVVKGLHWDTDVSEVKGCLVAMGYNVQRVSQMHHFRDKQKMGVFMYDVYVAEIFENIYKIGSMLGFYVTVEAAKHTKGFVKQCYPCRVESLI